MELFDYVKSLTTKKNKLSDDQLNGYKQIIFMINRFVSMEFIELANFMNILKLNDERLHFDFFYYTLPKKFLKYIKKKNLKEKNLEMIDLLYKNLNISKKEAIQYLDMLSKKEIMELKSEFGGKI